MGKRERWNVPEAHIRFLPTEGCNCELCQSLRVVLADFSQREQERMKRMQPRDYAPEPLDFQNPMRARSVGKEMLIGALWACAAVSILLMLGIGLGVVLYGNWPLRGWVW